MNKRLRIQMIVAVALTAFGMVLISAAFVVPPLGVIHQSVLAVTGEIFSLVGALLIFEANSSNCRMECASKPNVHK